MAAFISFGNSGFIAVRLAMKSSRSSLLRMPQWCHIFRDMSSLASSGRFAPGAVALLTAPPTPVREPTLGQLNVSRLRALPFLIHHLQREQHLAESPLLGKEQSVNHALAVDFDLPNIASQLIDVDVAAARRTNLLHCHCDRRGILIRQFGEELTH